MSNNPSFLYSDEKLKDINEKYKIVLENKKRENCKGNKI